MDHATLSLVILGAVVVLFVWNRLPAEIVAVGTALTRTPKAAAQDMSRYARTIVEHYALEHDLYRLRVRERSPFCRAAASRS